MFMQLKFSLAAILVALLLTSGLVPPTHAQRGMIRPEPLDPVNETDGRFGVVQGIAAPGLAWDAGARWDRVIFPWSLIQKDGPDSWRELYYPDEAIRAQAARGVEMSGVVIYTPQWASVDPERGRPVDRPKNLELPYNHPNNHWGQFMRKLATRFKGVVKNWYVWNEPDLYDPDLRYTWDASIEDYYLLLKVAYLNIKEVSPEARVVMGGFAYWWDKQHGRPPYLASLLEIIGRDPQRLRHDHYFDVISVHTYQSPLNSLAEPLIMREIMDLRGINKPIWISESNVVPWDDPSHPLGSDGMRATLDEQASYIIQSMALSIAAGVEKYAIYKMLDEAPENNTEVWGLARNDLSIKPAYLAYQVGAKYFSGVRSATYSWSGADRIPTRQQLTAAIRASEQRWQFVWPGAVSQVTMDRGDRRTVVVWNNTPNDIETSVRATSRRASIIDKYGNVGEIVAFNGAYQLSLPGSSHNPDRRDRSLYMIGGDPWILEEEIAELPTDQITSRIEIVWPLGGAPLAETSFVNVTAQLLQPSGDPVPCRWDTAVVQLWGRINGGPPVLLGNGERRVANERGIRYPVWDFNRVNVATARDEVSTYELFVVADGVATESVPWTYGGPRNQNWRATQPRPRQSCQ
jgi:hypothetical protein